MCNARSELCPPRKASTIEKKIKYSKNAVVVQFDCHPEQAAFCAARDLGEPRQASRSWRRNNGALGSLPLQTAPLPKMRDYLANLSGARTSKNPAKSTIASPNPHVLKTLNLKTVV